MFLVRRQRFHLFEVELPMGQNRVTPGKQNREAKDRQTYTAMDTLHLETGAISFCCWNNLCGKKYIGL